jgi:RNA polymerase sigma-70 factor (ECF subfamily)
MDTADPEIERLIERASGGDPEARDQLLIRHRERLRKMVAVRMDRRLLGRFDPSDVVQDALADACQELPAYWPERPVPFYPWLRQIAWKRLVDLHRHHLIARKRSVLREQGPEWPPPDESVVQLADRLLGTGTSPSARMLRDELRAQVRQALARLSARDLEVMVMRHLEQLAIAEIAAVLGVTEGAVKVRLVRALRRLHQFLGDVLPEDGR